MYKKPIRRGQMIIPWGVGAMCNFPGDESLMVCGLDAWNQIYVNAPDGYNEFIVKEERLENRLGVNHFRLPPDFREPRAGVLNPSLQIPFVRFPQWHYCPKCGAMEKLSIYGNKQKCKGPHYSNGFSCHSTHPNRRPWLIPSRFIAICEKGHIEDFPFMEWVHRDQNFNDMCKLRLRAGRSASSLSGVIIECTTCEIPKKSMTGSFNDGSLRQINKYCSGHRPWLGEVDEGSNPCGQDLKVVQRGASNVYFPHIVSSIYLPRWNSSTNRRIVEILENNWSILTRSRINGKLNEEVFKAFAEKYSVSVNDLLKAAYKRLESENTGSAIPETEDSEEQYRRFEYNAIKSNAGGENQNFFSKNIIGNDYASPVKEFFKSISLLYKLTETRALVGFSRFLPEDGKSLVEMKAELASSSIIWLPAITVKGEGIFFEFNPELVEKWQKKSSTISRFNNLPRNYNRSRQIRGLPERPLNSRFVLTHTFAHILINQFSFICGYGSSALRERIYCDCNPESPDNPMNGILIYTSSGDTEGSLGGLVKQGNPGYLEYIVESALNSSKWCSSDPICINSPGQGPDSCNLAACHNCALLPETCCEEGNRLLDRGLLTGTPDNPEIGYFHGFDE